MSARPVPRLRGSAGARPTPGGSTGSTRSAGSTRSTAARAGGTNHAERVFRVQQTFTRLGGNAHSLSELARASGLDDSAVHRILQSGVHHGTFIRVGRGMYRLGSPAAQLGIHALYHGPNLDSVPAALQRLRLATDGGLVFFYSLTYFGGAQRQCVGMAVGDSDLAELGMAPRSFLSVTRSLRTGASGRAILAYLPEPLQERVLAEPVPAGVGPGAYRDNDELLASLAEIRRRGYAAGLEECTRGWNSCAAPVLWGGSIMGSVLVLKSTSDMPEPTERILAATMAAGAEISRLLDSAAPASVPCQGTA